ncbi:MAG: class I SAM-dependent methyltransferase [Promethearchaeota archaeon]
MNKKEFYEDHKNFSLRTITEYLISPGIRCKFDILKVHLGSRRFFNGIDLGCSGNSFIYFLENIRHKSFYDIALTPLNQYSSIWLKRLNENQAYQYWNPLCGDITCLPYRDKTFDFVSALDILEHIKDDPKAVSEISRVLKRKGIVVITVPHRMKYYTKQDQLIGHYRRYEIDQLISLFQKFNLKNLKIFGVYGRLMKISDIQSINPKKTEVKLQNLRKVYISNTLFRMIWNIFVKVGSLLMKYDARTKDLNSKMNLAFVFIKQI